MMKIGIIGAGDIGQLYAKLWNTAGHKIMLSSRNPDNHKLEHLLDTGVLVGTPEEAAEFGDVILLAVNYWTVDSAVDVLNQYAAGKLIIDATNPLIFAESGGTKRVIKDDEIAGELMQQHIPLSRIGKSFTTLWTGHVERFTNVEQPNIAMPFAADDKQDRQLIKQLVLEAGLVPVELGTLSESRQLDPPSPIWNVVLTEPELLERLTPFKAVQ